jgi:hypothetical protein
MSSVVEVCNRALQKLGASRITDLTDNSKAARACATAYEPVRDAALRRHVWNFSVKRAQLAASTVAPMFGPANAYPLPADWLRLLPPKTEDGCVIETDWQIENGTVVTNDGAPLNVRYVARVTDPNAFDVLFREALACYLAVEMCEELTQSGTKKQQLRDELRDLLAEAKRTNAIEKNNPAEAVDDPWIRARL